MFTGEQPRDGVAVLPLTLARLFGPEKVEEAEGVFDDDANGEGAGAVAANNDFSGYNADAEDDAAAKVDKNFVFNWQAYKDMWAETPVHVAVTSMFAEYATLHARIAGRTAAGIPTPITPAEGTSIAEQATAIVNKFVVYLVGWLSPGISSL